MGSTKYDFDLGKYSRTISSTSSEAQRWFDRGMVWSFAFHHEEAIICFERALHYDPKCAMAYWGISYANGPNYNLNVDSGYYSLAAQETGFPSIKLAFEAIQKASPLPKVEVALIEAMQLRYTWPPCSSWHHLNKAFADAMKDVLSEFPNDADVCAIYASSLMDLRPWKLWDPPIEMEGISRCPNPREIQSVLERGLDINPMHPGLCHFYIHLMEMSKNLQGQYLSQVCDALKGTNHAGHLLHMPSHIYVQIGDYSKAVQSNIDAIRAGKKLDLITSVNGFFLGYIAHDFHMLVYVLFFFKFDFFFLYVILYLTKIFFFKYFFKITFYKRKKS
eukprot:GSMAST32.ASY1.ANO1.35.1 assembled CDS